MLALNLIVFFSSKLLIYCICVVILPVESEAVKSLHCVVSELNASEHI